MMGVWMFFKVLLKKMIVCCIVAVEGQFELDNVDLRKMFSHVISEAHLTVALLLAYYFTVFGNLHKHDFSFSVGNKHEHACGKISA